MGLHHFKQHSSSDTLFHISETQALLLVEGKEIECFYFENPSDEDFKTLSIDISKVKFIGPKSILEQLKRELKVVSFFKEVVITQPTQAVFYAHSGKVRIVKREVKKNEKKKVLIIDDSRTIQKLLKKIISSSDNLEVMACADGPSQAKEIIEKTKPDLITLDVHMPEMNGVDFLKTYLRFKGIPTVMITSVSIKEGPLIMDALSSGAATYIQKPSLEGLSTVAPKIIEELTKISEKSYDSSNIVEQAKQTTQQFSHFDGLIAIGSSTGGTQALEALFKSLPNHIPPIVIAQHIPAVFSKALADRLNNIFPFTIKEAEDGEFLKPDTIYIAPGGNQMKILKRGDQKRIEVNDDPPMNRFKPSVDYLFNTLAKLEEPNLIGVMLTGMGRDGSKGMLKMKQNGAYNIAQDQRSSVVFGMPKAAIEVGATDKVLHLHDIADELVVRFNKMIEKKAG